MLPTLDEFNMAKESRIKEENKAYWKDQEEKFNLAYHAIEMQLNLGHDMWYSNTVQDLGPVSMIKLKKKCMDEGWVFDYGYRISSGNNIFFTHISKLSFLEKFFRGIK